MSAESAQGTVEPGELTAAILAGGLGTRLRSRVRDRPKVLAPVRGRPYLVYLLDQLVAAGVGRVVLCTGYLGELVEEELGAAYRSELGSTRLVYSRETGRLGTGGALRLALPSLGPGATLVLNGDSYCDVDLAAFRRRHLEIDAAGSLALTRVEDTSRYGSVDLGDDDELTAFREKGGPGGSGWINAGVYLLERRVLESIPREGEVSLEREVLPAWIGRGLHGFRTEGRFLDIGTPESYTAAERFFAGHGPARGAGSGKAST